MEKDRSIESFRRRMKDNAKKFGITYAQMLQIFRSDYSLDIAMDYHDSYGFCEVELGNEGVEII